jgi:hypothetical protein
MGLGQRHPRTDVLGGTQLRANRRFRIHPPQPTLTGGQPGAPGEQLGHHRRLARTRSVLGPGPADGGIHQRRFIQRGEVTNLRQRAIEHRSETTDAIRPEATKHRLRAHLDMRQQDRHPDPPVDEIGFVDNFG